MGMLSLTRRLVFLSRDVAYYVKQIVMMEIPSVTLRHACLRQASIFEGVQWHGVGPRRVKGDPGKHKRTREAF